MMYTINPEYLSLEEVLDKISFIERSIEKSKFLTGCDVFSQNRIKRLSLLKSYIYIK